MNLERRIWGLANLTTLSLVIVSLAIVYWQLIRAGELQPVALSPLDAAVAYAQRQEEEIAITREAVAAISGTGEIARLEDLPQPVVQRTSDLLATITRGAIFDRQGRLLAYDQSDETGARMRFYNEPSLAHVIGYVSTLRTGVSGLELSYNQTLLGLNRPEAQLGRLLHQPIIGTDLILTIDTQLQRAAQDALQDNAGAIIILDGHSGAVLAMANSPRFDPNRILEPEYIPHLLDDCDDSPACRAPFLNRATQALYPPGSTWKTVTLIAALDSGFMSPDFVFDFGEPVSGPDGPYYVYRVGGGVVPDPNHQEDRLSLEMSYAKSANAAFARIGDEMPPEVLVEYAGRLGYGLPGEITFPIGIESSVSQIADGVEKLYDNDLLRAVTAIGQGELLTTPLNLGLVTLSVINQGNIPVPYFVESLHDPSGEVLNLSENRRLLTGIMAPETADQVQEMMATTVERGSGARAAVPGLTVGGKTGTAQIGADLPPHAWFTGFAEQEDRSIVMVVLIENGGEGSQFAAPIFAQLAPLAIEQISVPMGEIAPAPLPTEQLPTSPGGEPTLVPTETAISPIEQQPTESPPDALAPTPTSIPAATPVPGSPPPADIPRDPEKEDLTATTCPTTREILPGTGTFIWPSQYQALSGTDFMEGHPGIDLSAPPGSAVYAADSGLVVFAGWTGIGYGNTILIDHGNGFQTLYAHLSQISVHCGARVEKGKFIGFSGSTGNSSGPHLHFEVRVPGGYLNPLSVLPTP
ncbi:MAG TPA: penicillin-binding transpeptidase domain-containing protein [Anaerolineales bacterium]